MNSKAIHLAIILLLAAFSGSSAGDENVSQTETTEPKQRIEELEQRHKSLKNIFDKVSVGGVLSGAYQYQFVSRPQEAKDRGRGGLAIQPEVRITPTDSDELFFKFGFGAGNGLNEVAAFNLASWAADLEDDVKDINGRGRNYLLTAWYKHTVTLGAKYTLGITGGIIDATDYIDENAFANDEYTQFMNEALVNSPNGFTPSYDIGGAVEWAYGDFSVNGLGMRIGENDDENSYTFWGIQFGYHVETTLGNGNYRIVYQRTSDDFLSPDGTGEEYCQAYYLSCDQELGPVLGIWLRVGTHDDDEALDYQNFLTGGFNIRGKLWGREQDNIGIGYAYLNQGNLDIDKTHLFEAYLRIVLNDIAAVSFDVQYEKDDYKSGTADDVHGWITSVRMTVGV